MGVSLSQIELCRWPAEGFIRRVLKDKYSWVLWQIQVSNRTDDVLSSIDINLTPARYRVKDVSDFWRIEAKEKEKRRQTLERVECSLSRRKIAVFIPMLINDEESDRRLPIGNREKCENSVRDVARPCVFTHHSFPRSIPCLGVPFTGLR